MSKAFVREDDVNEERDPLPVYPVVPPGSKNYLTAAGRRRLEQELVQLQAQRSALSARLAEPEIRQKAQALDHRLRHVQASLRTAEVMLPNPDADGGVRFGATVTVRDQTGVEARYRIVGVDETDVERNEVSWLSPIARALLNRHPSERVRFRTPRGEIELEILAVSYE